MQACLKIVEKTNFLGTEFSAAKHLLLKTKSVNIIEYISTEEVTVDGIVYVALLLEYANGGVCISLFIL
jgi:hypothetical protein